MEIVKEQISDPLLGFNMGQTTIKVHDHTACSGEHCVFHNPSEHKMRNWQINIRLDKEALVERICEHGVGHPDPDSLAHFLRLGKTYMGIHGCCGCCGDTV